MKKSLFTLLFALVCAGSMWGTPAVAVNGKLPGAFSVSSTKVVYFSQGNLQYNSGTQAWQWAAEQYSYVGNAAGNTSINTNGIDNNNGVVDLFGWVGASSTWTGLAQYGISSSTTTNDVNGYGNNASENLKSDWGGLMGTGWRTLTTTEWQYLFNTRTPGSTANNVSNPRYTEAKILTDGTAPAKDICGVILFPDNFNDGGSAITGVTWGMINNPSAWSTTYCTTCTTAGWTALEDMGCVFLPAAGYRYGTTVYNVGGYGRYWSSSPYTSNADFAYRVYFYSGAVDPAAYSGRHYGISVRLVSETAPKTPASVTAAPTAKNLTYTGSAQALVNAGTASGGTLSYSLDNTNWSEDIPTGTNAGEYTVYYKVQGDASHTDYTPENNKISVIIASATPVDGKLPKKFTVSGTKQVKFSQGNLQYQQSTHTWRLAPVQTDWRGMENLQMGNSVYDGWVDLFCWSLGETNNYGATSDYLSTVYHNADFVDWGVKISGDWSTMSSEEFKYILEGRPNANDKWGMAKVDDNYGLVLLPDEWTAPAGITFVPRTLPTSALWDDADRIDNTSYDHYRVRNENMPANLFTAAQWYQLEANGAIFLPCAGRRSGGYGNHINRNDQYVVEEYNYTYYENYLGTYWTNTQSNREEGKAHYMYTLRATTPNDYIWGKPVFWGENGRYGQSVRLTNALPSALVTAPLVNAGLVATGSAQELITAGVTDGGTIEYQLAGGEWQTTVPTATAAGSYTVRYRVTGDNNHSNVAEVTLHVTIASDAIVLNENDAAVQTQLADLVTGGEMHNVTIQRSIIAGCYNTICLPFDLSAEQIATGPLAGYNLLQAFDGADVSGSGQNLLLNLYVVNTDHIEAGKPYLISFPSEHGDIVNPRFDGVTITANVPGSNAGGGVTFQGMFAPVHIDPYTEGRNEDNLFLGANNRIMWPNNDGTSMRGFRAYFIVNRTSLPSTVAPRGTAARIVTRQNTPTDIETVTVPNTDVESRKVLIDGVLYIIRNGVKYNLSGQIVK